MPKPKLALVKDVCPRCGGTADTGTYAPCSRCRSDLRAWAAALGQAARVTSAALVAKRAENA